VLEIAVSLSLLAVAAQAAAPSPSTASCQVLAPKVLGQSPLGFAQVSNLDLITIRCLCPSRRPMARVGIAARPRR
jgi:hypothetical protein